MNYYRIKIRDRKSAGEIGWIADFIMAAISEGDVLTIIKTAYPDALEHHAEQITFIDWTRWHV